MNIKSRSIIVYFLLLMSIIMTLWMFCVGIVLLEALSAAIAEEEGGYYEPPSPIAEFLQGVYDVSPPLAKFLIILGAPPIGPIIVLMLWITAIYLMMSRMDEKDAIHSLRTGFIFSLITVSTLLTIFLLRRSVQTIDLALISLPVVFVCFILGLYNRIYAWGALKQNWIKWALSSEIVAFLIIFCFAGFVPLLFWLLGSILYLLPIITWIIATFMEVRGFEWVKQNLNINLSLSKKLNILGIVFFIIGMVIQYMLIAPYAPLTVVTSPFSYLISYPILLSYPFLIASCLSSIIKLKSKPQQ
ncbi:MAG: hypothetical protein ACPLYF_03510 [Fervidobacterium sp.]